MDVTCDMIRCAAICLSLGRSRSTLTGVDGWSVEDLVSQWRGGALLQFHLLREVPETWYWNEMNGTFLLWSSYVYGQFLDHFLCLVCFFAFPVLLQFHSSTSFTSQNHRLLQDPGVSHVQTVFNRSHYQHIHSIAKDRGLWDYFLMVFDMMWHFRLLKNLSRMNPICETWECVDLQVD